MTSPAQEDILTVQAATKALEAFQERLRMLAAQIEILERRTQAIRVELGSVDILRDIEDLRRRLAAVERTESP